MATVKIAITDDATLFRKGLILLLEDYEDIEVIMEAENGQDLLDKLAVKNHPDIIILDLQMPVLDGIATAKILKEKYPVIKIIILSTHYSKAFILNMVQIGASAYLPKNADPDTFTKTIRNVYENGFHYSKEVWEMIQANMNKKQPSKPSFVPQLTSREIEILQYICEQQTAAEIAEKLFIARRTVEGHRNNLLQKLNCRNVAGLVVYAIENRLVTINPAQFW
jgi:DNA-binding NarL/FixJ family response regulator